MNEKFSLIVLQHMRKNYFLKWVQPAIRHRLACVKMFVLNSSLRKLMLTSWHFSGGGDILGKKKKCFFDYKMRKTGIILQDNIALSKGRNIAWLISERVLNKSCDAIINENYIFDINMVYLV